MKVKYVLSDIFRYLNLRLRIFLLQKMPDEDLTQMLSDIQDSLEDIAYTDISAADLDQHVEAGVQSAQFCKLVCFLANEVAALSGLEGHDSLQEAELGTEAGLMELSSLLRRLYTSRTNLFSDVTIVCADSKLVAAHKLVLAVTSQYFQAHL